MLEKRRLANELRALDSLQHHLIRELPWLRKCSPDIFARTIELLEAGVDLDILRVSDIMDARNLPEHLRQDLMRFWVFGAIDIEIARRERLVKQILDGEQEGTWWKRTLRHCLAPFKQPVQFMHQDDLTVGKSGACPDGIHDSFSSVSV